MRAVRNLERDRGYAMAALLVGMSVMAVALSVALPTWQTLAKREREAELVFRGQQYARAIGLFQRKYANAFPPSLDILLNERFLRKKYRDPMTKDGDFQLLYGSNQPVGGPPGQVGPGRGGGAQPAGREGGAAAGAPGQIGGRGGTVAGAQGGITGVASKSTEESLRLYDGRTHYNEWVFAPLQVSTAAGAPAGSQTPTGRGTARPGGPPPAGGRSGVPPTPPSTPRRGPLGGRL